MEQGCFELLCEFTHCREVRALVVGTAKTEKDAERWVAEQQDLAAQGTFNYRDDAFDCPVALCALKDCIPTYRYRPC